MAAPDPVTVGGIIIGTPILVGVTGLIFNRMKASKDQNDQFHKRDNDALALINENAGEIRYLKGYNDGLKDGKAEVRAELLQK